MEPVIVTFSGELNPSIIGTNPFIQGMEWFNDGAKKGKPLPLPRKKDEKKGKKENDTSNTCPIWKQNPCTYLIDFCAFPCQGCHLFLFLSTLCFFHSGHSRLCLLVQSFVHWPIPLAHQLLTHRINQRTMFVLFTAHQRLARNCLCTKASATGRRGTALALSGGGYQQSQHSWLCFFRMR